MQTGVTSANNSQHCWVLLGNNVASVCMGLKVWQVSNYTQQVPTSANIVVVPCKWAQHVTTLSSPTMLGVVGQQCWVRLHGPLYWGMRSIRAAPVNRPAPFCLRVGPLIGRFCKYFDCRALQVFVLYIKNNFTKNTEVQIEVGKLGHIKTPKLHHFLEFISYNKYLTFHIKLQKSKTGLVEIYWNSTLAIPNYHWMVPLGNFQNSVGQLPYACWQSPLL